MTDITAYLKRQAEAEGFALTSQQLLSFQQYADLLVEWNERMNLTAITAPEEIAVKHFLDSLLLLKFTRLAQNAKVIDVGTGAGFPSVPVRIVRPDLRERFDLATARAVAPLRILAEYCLPFVKPGGYFAALKGPDAGEEVKEAAQAVKLLGGKTEQVIEYNLAGTYGRTAVLIKKISQSSTKYPRPSAKIAKNPL